MSSREKKKKKMMMMKRRMIRKVRMGFNKNSKIKDYKEIRIRMRKIR